MSEQIREEFERVMPAPRYVYWDAEHQRYMSSGNPLGCIEYQGKWAGWKASRDSQPSGFTAVDMATAAADGFRDGAASKSEPCDGCFMVEAEALRKDAERYRRMRTVTLKQLDETSAEFDTEFDRQLATATSKEG